MWIFVEMIDLLHAGEMLFGPKGQQKENPGFPRMQQCNDTAQLISGTTESAPQKQTRLEVSESNVSILASDL